MSRTPRLLLSSIFAFLTVLSPGQARAGESLAEKLKKNANRAANEMKGVPDAAKQQVAEIRQEARQDTREVRQETRQQVKEIRNQARETAEEIKKAAAGGSEEARAQAEREAREAIRDGRNAAQDAVEAAGKKVEEIASDARKEVREAVEAAGGWVPRPGGKGDGEKPEGEGAGPSGDAGAPPDGPAVQSAATVNQTVVNVLAPAAPAPIASASGQAAAPIDRLPTLPEQQAAPELDLSKAVALPRDGPAAPADAKRYALIRSAKTSAHMREYKKAIEQASEILRETPGDAEALLTRAEAQLRDGNAEAAAADAEAAVRANPGSVQALVVWADALQRMKNTEAALKIVERALRLSPKDATLWLRRAALQDEAGGHADALASLARAAEINPRLERVYQAAAKGGRIRYPDFDEDLSGGDLPEGSRGFGLLGWLLAGGCLASLAGALWLARRRKSTWVEDVAAERSKPLTYADKYEKVRVLSSGADGEVQLAKDRTLERSVAVRRLPSGGDKERRARAAEAARAAGSIQHKAFVDVYDVLEDGDDVCVVSEALTGKTAAELLAQAGRLPLAQAVRVLEPACEALEAAHAKGVAHRKLSPSCVFITDQGRTKLTGLGVGQASAPFGEDGRRADVHGLAVCLYEMTTGAKPFGSGAADGRAGLDYVPPSERLPGLPAALDALLADALAPSPNPVIPTAADFLARLKALGQPGPAQLNAPDPAPGVNSRGPEPAVR